MKISFRHPVSQAERSQVIFLLFCMAVVTLAIYSKTVHYPFHFDDEIHILNNPNIKFTEFSFNQLKKVFFGISRQRPVAMLSFGLNYFFHGYQTFGYHAVNIIFHFSNGVLLFFLIRKTADRLQSCTSKDKSIGKVSENLFPFFCSLLWLAHPIHTSSVTLITQRMNLMAAFFYLSSMLFYIEARVQSTHSKKTVKSSLFFFCSFFCALFALGSKEISIMLPFLLLLYEYFFFQDLNTDWLKKNAWHLLLITLLIAGVFSFIIVQIIEFDPLDYIRQNFILRDFTMAQRVLTEFRVVLFYIMLLLFPHPDRLNFDHNFELSLSLTNPLTTLLSLLIISGLLAISIFSAKKERLLSFGILWYFGNLLIESSILPLEIIYEHRTYIPSMLPCVVITAYVFRFLKSRKASSVILLSVVLLFAFWGFDRNSVFKSPIALWKDCVSKSPGKSRPYTNLGRALTEMGRNEDALHFYNKALQLNPQSAVTLYNTGLTYYHLGNIDKAISYYQQALQTNPFLLDANTLAEIHNNIGVCYIEKKQLAKGIEHYQKAIELNPDHPNAKLNLKKAVSGLTTINQEIKKAQKFISKNPSSSQKLQRLAYLYYLKGDFKTALDYYLNVHEVVPFNAHVAYNIACMYALKKNKSMSVQWLKKAVSNGYDDMKKITSDYDLYNIRDTEFYKSLIRKQTQNNP